MNDRTHALYRFWDAAGQLLYVGITNNPGARFQQHQQDKPWWGDVAQITLETYPDRLSVLAAERAAIIAEKPTHNIVHNRGGSATPSPVLERLQPFQLGDWVALCLPEGRCPVGEIVAMDETWVSVRLKNFLHGSLSEVVEVVRWADVERSQVAYPEDAEVDARGLRWMRDEHLGALQSEWKQAHNRRSEGASL